MPLPGLIRLRLHPRALLLSKDYLSRMKIRSARILISRKRTVRQPVSACGAVLLGLLAQQKAGLERLYRAVLVASTLGTAGLFLIKAAKLLMAKHILLSGSLGRCRLRLAQVPRPAV
jgi:hypothetical protein